MGSRLQAQRGDEADAPLGAPTGSSPDAGGIAPSSSRCAWEVGTSSSRSGRGTSGRSLPRPPLFKSPQLFPGLTLLLGIRRFVRHVAGALPRVAHRVEVLADGFGGDLYPEALRKSLGKLGGVPGALLGKLLPQESFRLLGYARRVARSRTVGQSLQAAPFPAVQIAPDTGLATPGVGGDGLHVGAPLGEAQNLGAQAHLGLEIGVLLDLSQSSVFFLGQSNES